MTLRHLWRRLRLVLVAVLLVVLAPAVASAQDVPDEAEHQFQLGVERYRVGDFRAALEHFLTANRLAPNKNVVLNVARCYEQLKLYPEAYRYYSNVLDSETEPEAKERIRTFITRVTPHVAILQITTDPPGAILYINRKDLGARGSAPRSLGLAPGKYTVIAELPGYQAVESPPVDAQIGTTTPVSLKLTRVFGSVRIEGVDGATVRADSESGPVLCVAPCEAKVSPGKQTLFLVKEGFHTTDVVVDVTTGETTTVRPRLMVQTGTLVVTSDTKDALVTVDGKVSGLAPATLNLPAGKHRVSVAQSGYTPVEKEVYVREDETLKVALNLADQASEVFNATTTTATRTAEKAEEAPGSVTVITRQQILDMNARSLREVLSVYVPGMEALPSSFAYGDRTEESIFSRGILSDFSQQVLILHNGQAKYNDTTWGQPGLGMLQMTLDNVERVEISRTPIPLYGGSAVTVINIVTREQFVNGVEGNVSMVTGDRNGPLQGGIRGKNFSLVAGHDFGNWHLGGHVQFWDDKGQYHDKGDVRGGYGDTPNTITTPGANGGAATVESTRISNRTLRDGTSPSGAASLNIRSNDNKYFIDAAFRQVTKDAFLSGLLPSQSNDLYTYRSNVFVGSARYRPISDLDIIVGGMRMNWKNTTNFGGKPFSGNESNYGVFADIIYRRTFQALGKHSALAGLHVESEGQYDAEINNWTDQANLSSTRDDRRTFGPNDDRQALGVFAEDQWRPLENLSVVAGGRFDVYNGFGDKVNGDRIRNLVFNPRVAAAFSPLKEFLLKVLYTSAARPPSIYERTGINLPPLAGSPGTGLERIHTIELAGVVRLDQLKVSVTPFLQFFEDRIEYRPQDPTSTTLTAANSGSTAVRGIDVDARFFFNPRNYAFMNASYIISEDTATGDKTVFLPSTYLNGGVNLNFYNFNLNVTEWMRGPRRVPSDATGKPFVSETYSGISFWSTASLTYAITQAIRPYVTVENLTNFRNYIPLRTPGLAFPMRSQSYWVGLNYSWR